MTDPRSEYRFDPLRRDYVILAPDRADRPRPAQSTDAWREESPCPFCPGHEDETPPEILALRSDGSEANAPGWRVRVVPNRYPAVVTDGESVPGNSALAPDAEYGLAGYGSHEVVVETPDHDATLPTRSIDSLHLALLVYRERLRALRQDERLAHVQIFKNAGRAAGATRQHPHSQILALSTLPRAIAAEIDALAEFRRRTSRCLLCDILEREATDGRRVVHRDERYTAFCPYASRAPFETHIVPNAHSRDYADSSDEALLSLARILKRTVSAQARAVENLSYNLILHTAPTPTGMPGTDVEYHWRLELLPRVAYLAGFEWATGMYINQLPPEEAAGKLRDAMEHEEP